MGHAAAEAGCFQHPDIVGGVACRHGLGEGEAHLFAKVCEASALVDPAPHDVIEVGAVGQLAAHLHEVKAEVVVLFVEPLQRPLGEDAERRVRHIDEMAVLVFAVHAVQTDAVHLIVVLVEDVILAVSIVCILEVKLQGVVVVLTEIHQRVHLFVGHGVFCHDGAVLVHDAGTVAGDGIVEPDASQLAFPVDG